MSIRINMDYFSLLEDFDYEKLASKVINIQSRINSTTGGEQDAAKSRKEALLKKLRMSLVLKLLQKLAKLLNVRHMDLLILNQLNHQTEVLNLM